MSDLLGRARAWADADPHDGDRAEIEALISSADLAELGRRFAGPLTFGTAGLRGPLRAGPAGMNAAVVSRAAAGLGSWLAANGHAGGGVVIGYDPQDDAEVYAEALIEAYGEADPTDPVHSRVGGQYTLPEFDADEVAGGRL